MWKKMIVAVGLTVLLFGAMQSRVAMADNIWDMMNPANWFDDDDDDYWDDWYYDYGPGPYAYGPYGYGPYGYGWGAPPPYFAVGQEQSEEDQPPPPHIPE